MSGSNHSSPAFLDPQRGDVIKVMTNSYEVTGRDVADSVRVVRVSLGGHRLQGRKSLVCWRRLIERGVVVALGAR